MRTSRQPVANPFTTASTPISPVTSHDLDIAQADMFVPGPAQPVGAPAVVMPVLGRQHPVLATPLLWVAGCHGGSGASSVAYALGPSVLESPRAWPSPPSPTVTPKVLLTARTTFSGLANARVAAQEWASGAVAGVQLLGLVLIADAPVLHPDVAGLLEQVLQLTPRGWFLPWQEPWRALPVTDRPLDRAGTKLMRSIISAAEN